MWPARHTNTLAELETEMNISWEGVLFLWVFFLWPVILGCFYLVWKKESISKKGKFFLVSVALGYGILVIGNILGGALILGSLKLGGFSVENPNAENVVNIVATASMAILFLLPAVSTHYIAKKFS